MVYRKAIELFLVNGTADSIVIAKLLNWNENVIKILCMESLGLSDEKGEGLLEYSSNFCRKVFKQNAYQIF